MLKSIRLKLSAKPSSLVNDIKVRNTNTVALVPALGKLSVFKILLLMK